MSQPRLIEKTLAEDSHCRLPFQQLVAQYRRPIYNLLYRLLGSEADAEDLTQEVFLKAFCAYSRFRRDSSHFTWLYRIAINSFRDHLRRSSRVESLFLEPQGQCSVEGQLEQKELEIAVAEALLQVPSSQRMVVVLHDLLGFPYQEIATIASISMGTVKSRLFYGRRALRKILGSKNMEGEVHDR
jgi:RNA polymerase sigma-70 factor (ECF subfamily)